MCKLVVIRSSGRFLGFLGYFHEAEVWAVAGTFCNATAFGPNDDNVIRHTFQYLTETWEGDYTYETMPYPDIRIDDYEAGTRFRNSIPMYRSTLSRG